MKKRTPGNTSKDKNHSDGALEQFFIRVKRDPAYLMKVLQMLEINKLEAVYQDRDKPQIFIKTFDDLGIVVNCQQNAAAETKVSLPRDRFTNVEIGQFLGRLAGDEHFRMRFELALQVGQIEKVICSSDLTIEPLFDKNFDEFGLPTEHRMNWPVTEVPDGARLGPSKPGNKKKLRIKD